MPDEIAGYRVFIASPGGLGEERRTFKIVLQDHCESDALHRGVLFQPIGWEITLGGDGRPQELINKDLRECDYFLMVLWDRWGSPPDNDDDGYTSGTEEEYNVALECLKDKDCRMRNVIVFFKSVDDRQLSDPGQELTKVLDFKKQLEAEKKLLYHTYDDLPAFETLLNRLLHKWVRDHENETPPGGGTLQGDFSDHVTVSDSLDVTLTTPTTPPTSQDDKLIEEAIQLADEGKLVDAEVAFARATAKGNNPKAFYEYGIFLDRVGRLSQSMAMYERLIELSEETNSEKWKASALNRIGNIYQIRSDMDNAMEMYQKSLAINEGLENKKGMADQYSNMGVIYTIGDDLDNAMEMYQKSLAINEGLGRKKGMAVAYGNMGLLYQTRGDLDKTMEMYKKALAINEELGHKEGMATQYGNMGNIYSVGGDLDKAMEMCEKALAINEELGSKGGMAIIYGNMGNVYQSSGDLDKAKKVWIKSLQLFEEIGAMNEIEKARGLLEKLKNDED